MTSAQRREQLHGAGTPRHLALDAGDDPVEELLDDLRRLEVDPHVLADVATGDDEVVADQVERVLTTPCSAVALGELELGLDPVGLGVDEGAVHVPQDCGRAHQSSGS